MRAAYRARPGSAWLGARSGRGPKELTDPWRLSVSTPEKHGVAADMAPSTGPKGPNEVNA